MPLRQNKAGISKVFSWTVRRGGLASWIGPVFFRIISNCVFQFLFSAADLVVSVRRVVRYRRPDIEGIGISRIGGNSIGGSFACGRDHIAVGVAYPIQLALCDELVINREVMPFMLKNFSDTFYS